MTKMKDSGIEWIGEIPEEWGVGRVKDFYNFFTGTTPDTGKTEYYGDENGNTWITISDMKEKYVASSKQTLSDLFIKTKVPSISPKGSLLYSFKLSVGKVSFARKDLYTNEAIATFLSDEKVNLNFLYYASFLIEYNAEINIYGSKILNRERINNAILVNPSLVEQNKIADFLDKKVAQMDKVKALLEEQIATLQDYRQSLIYETVTKGLDKTVSMKDSGVDWIGQVPEGWGVKPIKYIFGVIGSGTTPDSSKQEYYDGDINWLQSGDLYKTDYVDTVSKTITELGYKSSASLKIYQAPFVALAMYGASIGNLAISRIDACVNQAVVVIKAEEATVRFAKYALECSKTELIFAAQGGTQPNINQVLIKNWKLPLPNESDVKRIADFLDKKTSQINQMIDIKQKQIDNINQQRQTLIYDIVTGKRRV